MKYYTLSSCYSNVSWKKYLNHLNFFSLLLVSLREFKSILRELRKLCQSLRFTSRYIFFLTKGADCTESYENFSLSSLIMNWDKSTRLWNNRLNAAVLCLLFNQVFLVICPPKYLVNVVINKFCFLKGFYKLLPSHRIKPQSRTSQDKYSMGKNKIAPFFVRPEACGLWESLDVICGYFFPLWFEIFFR